MREIVLDTETTGLDPEEGHKIIEIGGVELLNHIPTGRTFHAYLNPLRDVPLESTRVHGITTEFLQDKPVFSEVVGDFLEFLGKDTLVIHNAEFDMKFINAELKASGFKSIPMTRVVDTLLIARQKFPGQPANLDALCRRFKVDNSTRTYHGALLDSELLAEVYLELIGGRQHGLGLLGEGNHSEGAASCTLGAGIRRQKNRPARSFPPSEAELEAHRAFLGQIKNPVWKKHDSAA